MIDLNGNFSMFVDSLFDLVNTFLGGMFGWLTDLISGITFLFPYAY